MRLHKNPKLGDERNHASARSAVELAIHELQATHSSRELTHQVHNALRAVRAVLLQRSTCLPQQRLELLLRTRRLHAELAQLGATPSADELHAAAVRASEWLRRATQDPLHGDTAAAASARACTAEAGALLYEYAAEERGAPIQRRHAAAAEHPGVGGDRAGVGQRFYYGTLVDTGETRADGRPRSAAAVSRSSSFVSSGGSPHVVMKPNRCSSAHARPDASRLRSSPRGQHGTHRQ